MKTLLSLRAQAIYEASHLLDADPGFRNITPSAALRSFVRFPDTHPDTVAAFRDLALPPEATHEREPQR